MRDVEGRGRGVRVVLVMMVRGRRGRRRRRRGRRLGEGCWWMNDMKEEKDR